MKNLKFLYLFLFVIGLASCKKEKSKEEGGSNIQSIILSLSSNKIDLGESISFSVKGDAGTDLTNSVKYYVDGVEVTSNEYTPNQVGTYEIKATYKNLTSNLETLEVEPMGPRFTKHPVIEDYTGTWCGWCPRVAYAIEKVEAATDKAIPIAIHAGDVMETSYYNTLKKEFSIPGFPTAYLDRNVMWKSPEPNNVSQVTSLADEKGLAGIYLKSEVNGTSIDLKVKVHFGKNFNNDLKLVVLILEDDIEEDQKNYTSYYGGASVLDNFKHQHVLRYSITSIMGDDIPQTEIIKDNIYEKDFTLSVPSVIANKANMSFVAMLVDSNKRVINARSVKPNETEDFEKI